MLPSIKSIPPPSCRSHSHKQFLIKSAKLQWISSPSDVRRPLSPHDFLYASSVPPLPLLGFLSPLLFCLLLLSHSPWLCCISEILLETISKNVSFFTWLCGLKWSLIVFFISFSFFTANNREPLKGRKRRHQVHRRHYQENEGPFSETWIKTNPGLIHWKGGNSGRLSVKPILKSHWI